MDENTNVEIEVTDTPATEEVVETVVEPTDAPATDDVAVEVAPEGTV